MNPFLLLETRLAALLSAHPYFAGVPVITEAGQNIEAAIEAELARAGFCAVITLGRGDCGAEPNAHRLALADRLEFTIALARNSALDSAHHTLDGLWAAIAAINGQGVDSERGAASGYFQVSAHDSSATADASSGLYVQQLTVVARIRLNPTTYSLPV